MKVGRSQKLDSAIVAAVLLLAQSAACLPARAQFGLPGGGGQIDIQANEQEFAGDHVIARGNVRVTYKDSVVVAPIATLYRDASGNPQRAVFTGHPRLTQGKNRVDADTLVFEIAGQKLIAEGNSHSEVVSDGGGGDLSGSQTATKGNEATANAQTASIDSANADEGAEVKKKPVGEKIVTDADRQEYDRASGKFEAKGRVRVRHGDINVKADKLQLVYGQDNKPESAVFSGNVSATQKQNNTQADTLTYFLQTKRLQATGNVRSKVIQTKAEASKKGGLFAPAPVSDGDKGGTTGGALGQSEATETITILSDSQDYSQDNGRVTAEGNVKLFYQDTIAVSPKVILVRNEMGQADTVIMSGRSQISQPGKRWIADRITFTVADKRVLAEGNTKAIILQGPKGPGRRNQMVPPANMKLAGGQPPAATPLPAKNTQIGATPNPRTGTIGATKIQRPE